MNRQQKRAQKSVGRSAVKKAAKAAGLKVPPLREQDPAAMAVRITALEDALERLVEINKHNNDNMLRAFSMVDAHLFVLQRVVNDASLNRVRYFPVHDMDKEFLAGDPDRAQEMNHTWLWEPGSTTYFTWYNHQYQQMRELEILVSILKEKFGCWPTEKAKQDLDEDVIEEFGGENAAE